MEALIWVVLAIGLAIAEAFTVTFLVIFFAAGALAAAGAAALGADLLVQLIVFAVVSGISVAALRPIIMRHSRPAVETGGRPFGIEALAGSLGIVIDEVTGDRGMIRIDGELWQARSADDQETFAPGDRVRVVELQGATLLVWQDDLPNL
ncbi:NfeD family protein [Actinoplanes xinjiangensis]|uniref:NfeD family protein n=1 Tax=Actinoplanes xinjiangensis TaxID=512350 RepID=UPI00343652DA